MRLNHRCPKCQGTQLLRTHVRVEQFIATLAGLAPKDRWYEEWVCAACRYCELYRLDAMPERPEVDAPVSSLTPAGPYR